MHPTPGDTVVLLGDMVDRGPGTRQVIDRLLQLKSTCKLIAIMGNHEEMMRGAITGRGLFNFWLDAGGKATLDSYGGNEKNIPPAHIRFLTSCVPYWVSDREIFLHANLEPGVSLKNQTAEWLRWKHLGGSEAPHPSGKRIICGHTPQTDGVPWVSNGWVCLDTCPLAGKYLSCLDVATNDLYQATQTGVVRLSSLARFEPQ